MKFVLIAKSKQFLLALGLLCVLPISAFTIKGKVTSAGSPLEGVKVSLFAADSTLIYQDATDWTGGFTLKTNQEAVNNVVRFSFVGYETVLIVITDASRRVDLGTIEMKETGVSLDEVVVTASGYQKVDRRVLFPKEELLNETFNGLEVLERMQLPGLLVNSITNTVQSQLDSSKPVQLRLDGVPVTLAEIRTLPPSHIYKVEYIDMPGVRYGEVAAVINIIRKQSIRGLSFNGNIQAAATPLLDGSTSLKYNMQKSEFGFSFGNSFSDYDKYYINETQTLMFPGQPLSLVKESLRGRHKNNAQNFALSYNWKNGERTLFSAILRNQFSRPDFFDPQRVQDDLNKQYYTNELRTRDKSYIPTLELYFHHMLDPRKTIVLNVISNYVDSDYKRFYQERDLSGGLLNDFSYNTDGKKYGVASEALFENNISRAVRLTFGVKYDYTHAKNIYKYDLRPDEQLNTMDNSELYTYGQLGGAVGKLSYQLGLGVSAIHFKEFATSFTEWRFRPQATMSYALSNEASLRYNFGYVPIMPGIETMSEFEQWKNPYEVYVGNPNLRPGEAFSHNMQLVYRKGRLTVTPRLYFQHNNNTQIYTMSQKENEQGCYIEYQADNLKSHKHLQGYLAITYQLIKNHLSVMPYMALNRYWEVGENFQHQANNVYMGFSLNGSYKNWSFTASYGKSNGRMTGGETYSRSYASSSFGVRYRYKALQFGLSMVNPFLAQGNRSESGINSRYVQSLKSVQIKNEANQLRLSVAWNLHLGRRYNEGSKKTYNYIDANTGIMK